MRLIASPAIDRALGLEHVRELAPDMGQARHLGDAAGAVDVVEAGIAVGVHPTLVAGEVVRGMLALPVDGEPIPCRRRRLAEPGPVRRGA